MGLYDVTLKKTLIGYQFDRPVYIGNQINDNRVVTYKELGNRVAAAVSSAEHVTYSLNTTVASSNGLVVTTSLVASNSQTPLGKVTFSFTYDSASEALIITASN